MIGGIDEAGRGTLCGPVVASVVIWDDTYTNNLIKDSKKLSYKKRLEAYDYILDNCIDYGIGIIDNKRIDEINILQATMEAMHEAIDNLNLECSELLIDGTYFKSYKNIPYKTIIKGDTLYSQISAASILAKVTHDKLIQKEVLKYPQLNNYNLLNNMGYATKKHIEGINKYGISHYHRKSFNLKKTI